MEIKHLEKKKRKYIIGALSSPTMFLYKKPGEYKYQFVKNIEKATKTLDRFDAEILLKEYYQATGDNPSIFEMVVVPVDITYELIEEI